MSTSGRAALALILVLLAIAVGGTLLFVLGGNEAAVDPRAGIAPVEPGGSTGSIPTDVPEDARLEVPHIDSRQAAADVDSPAESLGGRRAEDLPPRLTGGTLQVEVVDGMGEPVSEVPVAICFDRMDRPLNLLVQRSDESGVVTFRDVAARMQPRGPEEPGYAVALAIPLAQRVLIAFDPRNLPPVPLRLVLPSTGSLLVRIQESDGKLLVDEPALVSLGPPGDPQGDFRAYESRRASNGEALFPKVALGEQLRLRVVIGSRPMTSLAVEGPVDIGEQATATVTMKDGYPELVGRAIGPGGRPLGSGRGRVHLRYDRSGTRILPLVTLDDGQFKVRLFEHEGEAPERVEFEITDAGAGFEASRTGIVLAAEGPTDLGDVHFLPRPLLAEGRVVDTAGQPLAGVSVRIEVARGSEAFRTWPTVTSTTGKDGHFELYARPPEGKTRIVARRRGFLTLTEDLGTPGIRGIELILEAGEPARGGGR